MNETEPNLLLHQHLGKFVVSWGLNFERFEDPAVPTKKLFQKNVETQQKHFFKLLVEIFIIESFFLWFFVSLENDRKARDELEPQIFKLILFSWQSCFGRFSRFLIPGNCG